MTNLPAIEHLLLRLRPLNRALRAAVERQGRMAARLFRPDVTPLCVTEEQVQTLLGDVDRLHETQGADGRPALLTAGEQLAERELRERCAAAQLVLPLDRLARALDLTPFEEEAVLLCAAVELDRSYERIYAYILDDLNRRYPCIELLCSLTAETVTERCERRREVGRFGKLRRTGVLQPYGEPATELRQELRLASGLFAFLTGAIGDPTSHFRDPAEVAVPTTSEEIELLSGVDPALIVRSGQALREGHVEILGVWGDRHSCLSEAAVAIASLTGWPLRRWSPAGKTLQHNVLGPSLNDAVQTAAALGALLWIDTDALTEPGSEPLRDFNAVVGDQLTGSRTPVILTGTRPWRPTALLEARSYAEIELDTPGYATRQTMWERALPDLSRQQREDLAARFRVRTSELRAVARVARAAARLSSNGHSAEIGDRIEQACAAVTRKFGHQFATVINPRRGPDDLILPPELHKQVLEVAQFYRSWPRIAEGWGFGRLVTGEGGIKALFTGDSGTGKTLAAEIIAQQLQMPLLKIDLSRIVSKWVGETEKHLELAFREAEDSQAVLFFDEADALFGKRGEVQHGVDRYANLEVSYLLQRLEAYYGLVILASNLRDNIDEAFTRRFQVVLTFPRPETGERRRIWELAFPKTAPLEPDIDFDLLSRLDLTGAGIVAAAQTAALLALEPGTGEGETMITRRHIVRAVARQYRREARLLTSSELGAYAPLLQEAK
ncbi:MAG TPA: ATP-binding protein [Blastocatellia bacterium]|nr:ATP-binding protein [Blastocatellia bacterium]